MRLALICFATLVLGVVTSRLLPADDAAKPAAALPKSSSITPQFKEGGDRQVKVFALRHERIETAIDMLKQLGYQGGMVPDPRTNSLIANEIPGNLAKLEMMLKVIDRAPEAGAIPHALNVPQAAPSKQPRRVRANAIQTKVPFGVASTSRESVPSESAGDLIRRESGEAAPDDVRKLRGAFKDLDAQAIQIAEELRQMRDAGQVSDRSAALKRRLRDQVTTAYEVRRQMQQAEVKWLRQRLSRIEQQLESRGQLKDQIIDRRIEELLNPGTQWDPGMASNDRMPAGETAQESDSAKSMKEQANRNNLKQLALAMHNFHDTYGHFPKAVSTARDFGHKSDTPHSWRIDLLPFLGAADLHQQYKMDEPWDGPNNKKLLDRMPAVFRSPYDDPKSMSTAYAVLVGKGTVFESGREGIKIPEITDGTSNTILVVEARRNCPWMKPEDIPFEADKPVPELGGFVENKFAAVLADGRACTFERSKVEGILDWMIRRNDGHPIEIPFE
jgi:Protein of unknown function (DUF1559)